MALEEFEREPDEKSKRHKRMHAIMDYGMGSLWMAMGIFLLDPERFSDRFYSLSDPVMKGFGAVCILYGLFRIYSGYKKKYYNE